ncbi:hypothetical protein, partial [Klebsiella michiganensis]|uniref:hypothetical protein n=1 Tax=Klebsiella michiganensis TaxID=1134687 RepID=UPI0015AC8F0F
SPGDGGLNGGLARVNGGGLLRWGVFCRSGLLLGFTRFSPGDGGLNGGLARVNGGGLLRWGVFCRSGLLL